MITNSVPSVNLFALASSVAQHLPGKWIVDADIEGSQNWNQYLTRASDGLKLFFAGSRGGWAAKGKLRVSLSRPRLNGSWVEVWDKNEKLHDPEIGMSETKSAEQIAQSIVSRLLTDAENVFAKVNERIALQNSAQKAKEETIAQIVSASGETVRYDGSISVGSFNFTVNSGNSVAIKSYGADTETALAIIAFLKSREIVAS